MDGDANQVWWPFRLARCSRGAWIAGGVAALMGGCRCDKPKATPPTLSASSAVARTAPAPRSSNAAADEPKVLLSLPFSAYQATIAIDEEAVYVLTNAALHRIVVGKTTEQFPLDLGFGATSSAHSILFWSEGAIWEVPKQGGKAVRAGSVPHRPQTLVASANRFAWLDRSETGEFTIQTLVGQKPKTIYSSPGRIDAATMSDDSVFFVERVDSLKWHIGRVTTTGRAAVFAQMRRGSPPAMLAAFEDHIYYQDPRARDVLRLSRDFQREDTLAKGLVCSPLAVWESVFCSRVEGLVEVFGDNRPPRPLLANRRGELITAIAADAHRIAWLADAGPDKLAVKVLSRTPP